MHTTTSSYSPQTTLPLSGKVYAITGGANGIGLATARLLSSRGATVCIGDIEQRGLKEAEAYFSSLNAPVMITKLDVAQRSQVDSWIESIVREYGRLDGAANVAGIIGKIHGTAAITELEDAEWDRILAVNLTGTMYCLRAELQHIENGGSIVNVSSIHGSKGWHLSDLVATQPLMTTGFAKHAAYDASKHAVNALTKVAALENGHREVRVNSVAPGSIYTPLMQKEWDAKGRPKDAPFDEPTAFLRQGTAEETANVIAFLLGPESSFVSGSVYGVDGAWI